MTYAFGYKPSVEQDWESVGNRQPWGDYAAPWSCCYQFVFSLISTTFVLQPAHSLYRHIYIVIGTGDLHLDLGLGLRIDSAEPAFVKCMDRVKELGKKYNMPICGYVGAGEMEQRMDMGYRMSEPPFSIHLSFCARVEYFTHFLFPIVQLPLQ